MTPPLSTRLAALLLAALSLLPVAVAAQQPATATQQEVRGTVTEGGNLAPIEGAMVLLLDAGGTRVGGVLSGVNGRFRVTVPTPGKYRLRIDRIGFGSMDTEPFDVAAGQSVQQQVVSQVKPIELAGIDVKGSSQCRNRSAEGAATATVWEEARKALDAATWTSDRGLYSFNWLRFTRQMDEDQRVTSEKRTQSRGVTGQPFAAADPNLLLSAGFIERLPNGQWQYWAPDANVLLSAPFLDTHCFSLQREQRDGVAMIGLAFEPRSGRGRADVAGVLWIDQATAQLRDIDYHYTNLPQGLENHDSHGALTFAPLPNGTWIVKEWSITMPLLVQRGGGLPRSGGNNLGGGGAPMSRLEVDGYMSEGGIVQRATTTTGEVVMDDLSGGIRGVLVDGKGDPVNEGKVRISGTSFETKTDSLGSFGFTGVGVGTWSVVAVPFELEMAGLEGPPEHVKVGARGMSPVRLVVPSIPASLAAACEATPPSIGEAVVAGRVLNESSAPVSGAEVQLSWVTQSVDDRGKGSGGVSGAANTLGGAARSGSAGSASAVSQTSLAATATTDSRGAFHFCAIPDGRTVTAHATLNGHNSGEVPVALASGVGGAVTALFITTGEKR